VRGVGGLGLFVLLVAGVSFHSRLRGGWDSVVCGGAGGRLSWSGGGGGGRGGGLLDVQGGG